MQHRLEHAAIAAGEVSGVDVRDHSSSVQARCCGVAAGGDRDDELCALAGLAAHAQVAAQQFDQARGDAQAEPEAAKAPPRRHVALATGLRGPARSPSRCMPIPVSLTSISSAPGCGARRTATDTDAARGELDGIVEQRPQDALDLFFIADGGQSLGGKLRAQQQALLVGERLELLHRASHRVAEVEWPDVECDLAGVEGIEQQDAFDQVQTVRTS